MNRKQYEARLLVILDHSHEITRELHVLMTDLGEDPNTAEWSWLYELSRMAGSVNGLLYNEVYPHDRRPSALTEDDSAIMAVVEAGAVTPEDTTDA